MVIYPIPNVLPGHVSVGDLRKFLSVVFIEWFLNQPQKCLGTAGFPG